MTRSIHALLLLLLSSGCVLCKRADPGPAPAETARPTATAIAEAAAPRTPAGPLWSQDTYAVITGVLSFESASLAPFSDRMRKDRELYERLVERGVPKANMQLMLDQAVTVDSVRQAVKSMARRAGPGSTLLFYYAGHGMRDGDGKPFFAAHDTKDPASSALSLAELGALIEKNFRGSRVLLMADCCYSGALRDVARSLSDAGLQTVSLTSADASNLSTANWTFTQSVIDALRGDPLLDRNRDGTITLGEVDEEVADAMKYREKQRHGFFLHGVPMQLAWAKAQPSASTGPAGAYPRGAYVEARVDGHWRAARVVQPGSSSLVRLYDYCEATDRRVPASSLRKIEFKHYPVGAKIHVFWGGKIWPAEVTSTADDFHKITYPGWPAYWDEWVLSNRIADASPASATTAPGEKLDVEWQGTWYPAVVLKRSGNRALIHYEGYDATWDEWVGPERMRPRR